MDKKKEKPTIDMVQERYKGPGPVVAGLGEGALQAKFLAGSGLVLGGIAAFLFHKKASPLIEKFDEGVIKLSESDSRFLKPVGGITKWALSVERGTINWLREFEWIDNALTRWNEKTAGKVDVGIQGAIITSTLGGMLGSISGGSAGIQSAIAGKRADKELKSEISSLRTKLIETQSQLEDEKTTNAARKGTLNVATDERPVMDEPITPSTADTRYAKAPSASWTADIAEQKAQHSDIARG